MYLKFLLSNASMRLSRNKSPQILNVIHTNSGNWRLGGVVCRACSGRVRVASLVLVSLIASANTYMINK